MNHGHLGNFSAAAVERRTRRLSGPNTWSRKARRPEPTLPEPERLPAPRGPLDWFSDPVRVATAKAWGCGAYEW